MYISFNEVMETKVILQKGNAESFHKEQMLTMFLNTKNV